MIYWTPPLRLLKHWRTYKYGTPFMNQWFGRNSPNLLYVITNCTNTICIRLQWQTKFALILRHIYAAWSYWIFVNIAKNKHRLAYMLSTKKYFGKYFMHWTTLFSLHLWQNITSLQQTVRQKCLKHICRVISNMFFCPMSYLVGCG